MLIIEQFQEKNQLILKDKDNELFFSKCEYPFKTLWRYKYGHHKEWVSICYNCIKDLRSVRIRFISQIENIKRIIRCRFKLSNLELLYII